MAFYEAFGIPGLEALRATLDAIPDWIPVISDAKRGDLDNSSAGYAKALFDVWDFDAATFHPYMGRDSLAPFLARADRGILVLCRTSNPSAREFQDLLVSPMTGGDTRPMYEHVAMTAVKWNDNGNVGLVVGATYPDELERVRDLCPDMPILIPGVGTQEGSLERSVAVGVDEHGRNAIVNASRGVIYAGDDPATYQQAARDAASHLRDTINRVLDDRGLGWSRCKGWGDAANPRPAPGRPPHPEEEAPLRRLQVGSGARGHGHRHRLPDMQPQANAAQKRVGAARKTPGAGIGDKAVRARLGGGPLAFHRALRLSGTDRRAGP